MTSRVIKADIREVAEIPHPMSFGGALDALSDGRLLLLGKDSWRTFNGAFLVDAETGQVQEASIQIVGRFQAIRCGEDAWLLLDLRTGEIVLWNPVDASMEVIAAESGLGQWVAHDTLDGILYIVANVDMSGSAAGFDYELHRSWLARFDLASCTFKEAFTPVRGHDLRSIVVQDDQTLIGVGYGRRDPFCAHFTMDLDEIGNPSSRHVEGIRMEFGDAMTFVTRDARNGLLVLCEGKNTYALTQVHRGSTKGKVLWTYSGRKRAHLFFGAAVPIDPQTQLLFFRGTNNNVRVVKHRVGEGVEEIGLLRDVSISCGVQAPDGEVFGAGGGRVWGIRFPAGSF